MYHHTILHCSQSTLPSEEAAIKVLGMRCKLLVSTAISFPHCCLYSMQHCELFLHYLLVPFSLIHILIVCVNALVSHQIWSWLTCCSVLLAIMHYLIAHKQQAPLLQFLYKEVPFSEKTLTSSGHGINNFFDCGIQGTIFYGEKLTPMENS